MASVQIEYLEMFQFTEANHFLEVCVKWATDLEEKFGNGFSLRFTWHKKFSCYPVAEFRWFNKELGMVWYPGDERIIYRLEGRDCPTDKLAELKNFSWLKIPNGLDIFRKAFVYLLETEKTRIEDLLESAKKC